MGRQALEGGLARGPCLRSEASECEHGKAGVLDLLDLEGCEVTLFRNHQRRNQLQYSIYFVRVLE